MALRLSSLAKSLRQATREDPHQIVSDSGSGLAAPAFFRPAQWSLSAAKKSAA